MTARLSMDPVPEPRVAHDAGVHGITELTRVVNQNFRKIRDTIERAIITGGLIGDGAIVTRMLSVAARTLVGDVTGLIGTTADGGETTVERIRGVTVPAPTAGDDGKALTYAHSGPTFGYTSFLENPLTTRGDLLYRDASAPARLPIGGSNSVLASDGTDPTWAGLSALLDAVFSNARGAILYRGASAWAALAPGTDGYFLKTQGAGADPVWDSTSGGSVPLAALGDLLTHDGAALDVLPLGTDGHVLTADSSAPLGIKWAAGGGGGGSPHDLLDGSTHQDTVAQSPTRGSLIYGNATPLWDELAIGGAKKFLRSDGTDVSWQFDRAERTNASFLVNAAIGNNTVVNSGLHSHVALGTGAAAGDAARVANNYSSSSDVARVGLVWPQTGPLITAAMGPVFWADFKLQTWVNSWLQVGLASTQMATSAGKRTDFHQALLTHLEGTDTNFQFRTCDGAGNAGETDTGVAKDAGWHDVMIYTPDAGTTWICELDGVEVGQRTTQLPGTSTTLHALVGATTQSGGSRSAAVRTSYCKVQQVSRM